jgi:hypothetical protein
MYDRGTFLKTQFNEFWTSVFGDNKDYFSLMTVNEFDLLKSALSNINNIITLNATVALAECLAKVFSLSASDKETLLTYVKQSKPNSPGYDIYYSESIRFIAEVKCNRPINSGNRFGGDQKKNLDKDILLLSNGKPPLNEISTQDYFKFLGIHIFDSNTDEAVDHYMKNLRWDFKDYVELYSDGMELTKDKAYIIKLYYS